MRIDLNHLSMIYPTGKQALKDINLTLESPSLIGLVGPNGAGKSTLMKLLVAGLLPTGGDIAIDDKPLTKCEKELKKKLGYLPQDFGLYEELTIWEFLDYMAALKGIRNSRPAIEEAILATGLEEKKKARIKTLSGGQRQRVGIAQALLGEPEFLILTSLLWVWIRKNVSVSVIFSLRRHRINWYCCPLISLKIYSLFVTGLL